METNELKLINEIKALRQKVKQLEDEKRDLELLQETTLNHSDTIEEQLFDLNKALEQEIEIRKQKEASLRSSENMLRSLVQILQTDKQDLENLLENTTTHGDSIENLLYYEAKSATHARQELFSTLAETIPVGIIIARTTDNHIIYANSTTSVIFVEPAHELIGRTLLSLFYDEIGARKLLANLTESKFLSDQELYAQRKGGNRFWLNLSIRIIKFNQEETILISCQDVTDRKHLEIELRAAKVAAEKANQAKNTFLSNMSHELRTPLNAIINYSDILQEDAVQWGIEDLSNDLKYITKAGKQLLSIVNDILDICRLESGDMELHIISFEIADFLREIESQLLPQFTRSGNTFNLKIADNVTSIVNDPQRLRQCLINLLSNADKFTRKGLITLSVELNPKNPHQIYFHTIDNGIGISEENLAILFQQFVQIDSATNRKYEGTGLGLAISKKFCNLMGGDIEVKSKLGEGSCFTIVLPDRIS